MNTIEIRSTTGTAPLKFTRHDQPSRHVTIGLEDGSSQVYDVTELRRLIDEGILRHTCDTGEGPEKPTQQLRDLIEDSRSGSVSTNELHTALLILEYRLGLPLTRPEG